MFRGFIIGIIFIIVVAVGAGYYVLSSGLIPANADTKPGSIEMFIAGTSVTIAPNMAAPPPHTTSRRCIAS